MNRLSRELLDNVRAVIDLAVDADPDTLADGDSVVELLEQLARFDGVATRVIGRFADGEEWAVVGAKSPSAWLATRAHIPIGVAAGRVRLGRALQHLPATEQAWMEGEIPSEAARAIAAVRNERTAEVFERDEKVLVDAARELTHRKLSNVLEYWLQHADADGAEDDAAAKHERRSLHASELGGMLVGNFNLDAIGGAIFSNELRRIELEMFQADWADAKAVHGDQTAPHHLARTPAQRRADALVEMARRSGAMPAGSRLPEPLFTVVIGYETFTGRLCELASGTPVAPGTLVPWLDEGWFERVVFEPPSRIVDVSQRRRFFRGALRRGIDVRDGECFHEYCDEPAERCQVDHATPYVEGGLTTQENGRAACAFHNQWLEKQRRKRRQQE